MSYISSSNHTAAAPQSEGRPLAYPGVFSPAVLACYYDQVGQGVLSPALVKLVDSLKKRQQLDYLKRQSTTYCLKEISKLFDVRSEERLQRSVLARQKTALFWRKKHDDKWLNEISRMQTSRFIPPVLDTNEVSTAYLLSDSSSTDSSNMTDIATSWFYGLPNEHLISK